MLAFTVAGKVSSPGHAFSSGTPHEDLQVNCQLCLVKQYSSHYLLLERFYALKKKKPT